MLLQFVIPLFQIVRGRERYFVTSKCLNDGVDRVYVTYGGAVFIQLYSIVLFEVKGVGALGWIISHLIVTIISK